MARRASGLVAAWYRGAWWLWLLRPLELFFRIAAALRRALYGSGFLASFDSPVPVVVVGNITVGGTGKTPVVLALIEYLQSLGLRPGMISRGYGASEAVFPHVVDRHSRARHCGDEALLVYARTACPCVVAPDRPAALKALLARFQVDLVLSDDGLQHYALGRNMEIAVLDQHRGLGNGFCLPAGPLREPASRLATVDHLLYRGLDDPQRGVKYEAVALVNLVSGEERVVSSTAVPGPVHALAGIGQPDQFFDTLREHGFVLEAHSFADHHAYVAADFDAFSDQPIIMTEKDAVKCRSLCGENAWYLKINAVLPLPVLQSVAQLAGSGSN